MFVGEAVALDFAIGLPSLGSGVRFLGDGSTVTISAPDDFTLGYYDYQYVTGSDDAVFAVAFESLSGSASVAVSYGFDPTWSLDPAYVTEDAGTHTIADGINAVSLPAVSLAEYLAGDGELTIRVQVLSGSVDVDQIRLRIWPSGGAIGGWSPVITPTATQSVKVSTWSGIRWTGNDPAFGDQSLARSEAASMTPAGYAGGVAPTETDVTLGDWPDTNFVAFADSSTSTGYAEVAGSSVSFAGGTVPDPVPEGVEGVDWFRPPDSTHSDVDIVGSPSASWVQPYATLLAYELQLSDTDWISNDGPWWVRMESGSSTARPSAAGDGIPYATPSGAVPDAPHPIIDIFTVTPDPLDGVTVTLTGDGLYAEQAVIATDGDLSLNGGTGLALILGLIDTPTVNQSAWSPALTFSGYQPLEYVFTRAPYRYWTPTPATEIPLRIRQRGDGLGMGGPRVRGVGSRQRSPRVRGYA